MLVGRLRRAVPLEDFMHNNPDRYREDSAWRGDPQELWQNLALSGISPASQERVGHPAAAEHHQATASDEEPQL